MPPDLFADYEAGTFFDEVFRARGEVRPHYRALVDRLRAFTPDELDRRAGLRDTIFRNLGITFAVYGEAQGIERTWPLDLIPRIIPADEWSQVERGLAQRVKALNCFLEDLYVGERAALHDGVIPRWLVQSSAGFCRQAYGIPVPRGARCVVAGIDVVRDVDGT